MKARFTDSMNWLHTWAGLVVGWLLFAVFLTGTLAYFQHEISRWMQPELPAAAPAEQAVTQAQQYLQQHAATSNRWTIVLPGHRGLTTDLFWQPPPASSGDAGKRPANRRFERASLDGHGELATARESRGGQFFYRFHFDLHYMPVIWARWMVGVCSMLMLLALFSGIVIHKKIFKDFFTLQWRKGHKSWLDGHTITSVLALPFHLMITYTGLVTLMFLYMAAAVSANFDNSQQLFNALDGREEQVQARGQAAPLVPLAQIVSQARIELQGADISVIAVLNPGDQAAVVEVREAPTAGLTAGNRLLRYSGTSAELLSANQATLVPEQVRRTLINLHAGRFADPLLRWLYFLSGILGTAMIGSGLMLWSARRCRDGAPGHVGHKLVHALNGGTILGLPLAVAAYFWANRVLPLQSSGRAELEILCFFGAWLAMLLYSCIRQAGRLWTDGLYLLAAAYLLLPLLNAATSERHLGYSLLQPDWAFAGIDLAFLLTGLICLQTARLQQKRRAAAPLRQPTSVGGRV